MRRRGKKTYIAARRPLRRHRNGRRHCTMSTAVCPRPQPQTQEPPLPADTIRQGYSLANKRGSHDIQPRFEPWPSPSRPCWRGGSSPSAAVCGFSAACLSAVCSTTDCLRADCIPASCPPLRVSHLRSSLRLLSRRLLSRLLDSWILASQKQLAVHRLPSQLPPRQAFRRLLARRQPPVAAH